MVCSYYRLEHVPDHSTLSRKLSSQRRTTVLERFFQHVLAALPKPSAVVATDATGYLGRKREWQETKHAQRALEDWVKVHVGMKVDEFIVLSYKLTRSNVHDSQMFAEVWDKMPLTVIPTRSLADAAPCDKEERSSSCETGDNVSEDGLVLAALAESCCRTVRQARLC
jgi:hypothetical protein